MSTILKWAGNKTAIMSELKKHLPAGPRLVEPFAGSCAVMMETDCRIRPLFTSRAAGGAAGHSDNHHRADRPAMGLNYDA